MTPFNLYARVTGEPGPDRVFKGAVMVEGAIRRGRGRYGTMRDTDGKLWRVYGASCGCECFCAARVTPVPEGKTR